MKSLIIFIRSIACLAALLILAGCAAPSVGVAAATASGPAMTSTGARPKLLVLLVVDGLPQWQVQAYLDQLAADGFARFLDRGAWYSQARYTHAHTVTAAGHATVLTGAYPHRSGIIGNDWRDAATGAKVYNSGDDAAKYIGNVTHALDGTSPRNLKVETVGDVLRRADSRSKVIAISGKDRGAILLAGKSGVAYMYMDDTGEFATSTYYMPEHPGWVTDFNARRPADKYFKAEWKPLLPEAAYVRSVPDEQPWFSQRGGKLPMLMGAPADMAPSPSFYTRLRASPFIDALSLDFARAAIAGEGLGRDESTDILAISLSGHDYVNHAWSAESRLSHDHFLQLDRLLHSFFRDLDATVGPGNYLTLLTADHGFMPAPEMAAAKGESAGRISSARMLVRLNAGMQKRFGVAKLLLGYSASSLLLDKRLMAQNKLDAEVLADEARKLLLAEPGIAAAYTRRELESGSRADAPLFDALRKAWHRDVSGEVQYTLKPNWMFGSSTTTHGSPYDYDTHVPILLWGPNWVRPGRVDTPVDVVDIASTLAGMLRVAPPPAAEGKPLPLPAP